MFTVASSPVNPSVPSGLRALILRYVSSCSNGLFGPDGSANGQPLKSPKRGLCAL
jgi:hypothetical protein